eukprot:4126512-Pyramimonas_sp.AAC.1
MTTCFSRGRLHAIKAGRRRQNTDYIVLCSIAAHAHNGAGTVDCAIPIAEKEASDSRLAKAIAVSRGEAQYLSRYPNHPQSLDGFNDFGIPLVNGIIHNVFLATQETLGKIKAWEVQKRMAAHPTQAAGQ